MLGTGDFSRLKHDVLERYDDIDIPISFGILIADYRQTAAKEYLLNYWEYFNDHSGKYIDFFIPGYMTFETPGSIETKIHNKYGDSYYFDSRVFQDFISQFEQNFAYQYSFNPVLILVELEKKNFINTRKMIIELDDDLMCIRRSGVLFSKIFDIAHKYVRVEDFSRELSAVYVKGKVIDSLASVLDGDYGSALDSHRRVLWKYRVIN